MINNSKTLKKKPIVAPSNIHYEPTVTSELEPLTDTQPVSEPLPDTQPLSEPLPDTQPLPDTDEESNTELDESCNSDKAVSNVIINRGTGAGGSNTNLYGKKFEEKTNNENRLLEQGYEKKSFAKKPKKNDYYLMKTFKDKTIYFVLQSGLKSFIKNKYDIDIFRCPDEAYIIEYENGRKVIKILEKKEQNVEGSVETKLWSGPSLKREYELVLGPDFEVFYGFCLSSFLQTKITSNEKKYTTLAIILGESNIQVLFGDDENYFQQFDLWLNSSL